MDEPSCSEACVAVHEGLDQKPLILGIRYYNSLGVKMGPRATNFFIFFKLDTPGTLEDLRDMVTYISLKSKHFFQYPFPSST